MTRSSNRGSPISTQEDLLEVLGDSLTDALVWTDTDRYILGCNDVAVAMIGYAKKELVGKTLKEILPAGLPDEFLMLDAALGRRLFRDSPENNKCEVKTKSGQVFLAEVMTTNLRDPDKDHPTLVLIIKAVPQKGRVVDTYRTITHRIQNSPIGIYIVQDRKFRFANPHFQQDLGFDVDELVDIDPLSRVHPEDREMVRQNAIQMLKGKRSSGYEFRAITKDGEVRWVYETVTSIIYNGRPATLGSFMDITERK